jgi:hypothetical protein
MHSLKLMGLGLLALSFATPVTAQVTALGEGEGEVDIRLKVLEDANIQFFQI